MNRKIFAILSCFLMSVSAYADDSSGRKVLYWYDPMMPEKQFDKAGKSPFMDMDLVPKYADEIDSGNNVVAGEKPIISINSENMQKMGVRTEKSVKVLLGKLFVRQVSS